MKTELETANELIEKFTERDYRGESCGNLEYPKKYALICVNEIIDALAEVVFTIDQPELVNVDYYQKVKKLIHSK